jgi:hypothetical protein
MNWRGDEGGEDNPKQLLTVDGCLYSSFASMVLLYGVAFPESFISNNKPHMIRLRRGSSPSP